MIRIKNLSVPFFTALFASAWVNANAQSVNLTIGNDKEFRQLSSGTEGTLFLGGSYFVDVSDGTLFVGCLDSIFFPPSMACPLGATAFVLFGIFDGANQDSNLYAEASTVIPAVVLEPRRPDLVILRAAPASTLPRPQAGFTDNSFSLFYNLQSTAIAEYTVTAYNIDRTYERGQLTTMNKEIVPGSYLYNFPRLGNPNLVSAITGLMHPMPEGYGKINNQKVGVNFTKVANGTFSTDGFAEMSASRPNTFTWAGFSPSIVFAGVDTLFVSIRALEDPADPASDVARFDDTGTPISLFPNFSTGGDPRVILPNPFVTTYTTPPILAAGTTGVFELEFERNLQNSGISFEVSNRKFQIPVVVTDTFSDFASVTIPSNMKKGVKDDPDKDGFDNITEWALGTSPIDAKSKPVAPVPAATATSFGFSVALRSYISPDVVYTVQRSADAGKTWSNLALDSDWTIGIVTTPATATTLTTKTLNVLSTTATAPASNAGSIYRVIGAQKK